MPTSNTPVQFPGVTITHTLETEDQVRALLKSDGFRDGTLPLSEETLYALVSPIDPLTAFGAYFMKAFQYSQHYVLTDEMKAQLARNVSVTASPQNAETSRGLNSAIESGVWAMVPSEVQDRIADNLDAHALIARGLEVVTDTHTNELVYSGYGMAVTAMEAGLFARNPREANRLFGNLIADKGSPELTRTADRLIAAAQANGTPTPTPQSVGAAVSR